MGNDDVLLIGEQFHPTYPLRDWTAGNGHIPCTKIP